MVIKTINITLNVLVAFSVWCAALMFTIFIAMLTLHLLVISGLTAYHLLHS